MAACPLDGSGPPFKITVSAACSHLGGKRSQQDCGIRVETEKFTLVGVFDGHGADGFSDEAAKVAECFVQRPNFYATLLKDPTRVGSILFSAMQRSVFEFTKRTLGERGISFDVRAGHIYCNNSSCLRGGTTATLVFVDISGLVTTLNVGDSDAWMYTSTVATKLNGDHTPETPEEYHRLMSLNTQGSNKTECVYDRPPSMLTRGGSDVIPKEHVDGQKPLVPYYVCNLDQKPATLVRVTDEHGHRFKLAMTRALGDENLRKGGIHHLPSVSQVQIKGTSVIKIASDGYWDAIKTSEELSRTNAAISSLTLDANCLCEDWFTKTKAISDREFGGVGDNMWGYIITVESK